MHDILTYMQNLKAPTVADGLNTISAPFRANINQLRG